MLLWEAALFSMLMGSLLQGDMLASIFYSRLVVLTSTDCSQLPEASMSLSHLGASFAAEVLGYLA